MDWSYNEIRTETSFGTVVGGLKDGKTQADVVRETGLSKGRVSQIAKQARQEGVMCLLGV